MPQPKYFIVLVLIVNNLFAMTIPYGEVYVPSKAEIKQIILKATEIGIKETSEINIIRSWRNGHSTDKNVDKFININFKPHVVEQYYEINYSLFCNAEVNDNWSCSKKENIYIAFEANKEKHIITYNKAGGNINILVEVARAANNLRPMSWNEPISKVYAKPGGDFIVTFGSYASCARHLIIRREYSKKDNMYKVLWNKFQGSCTSIGGYIDTNKLYTIYENEKWLIE
jgi:hypothetical protein